MGDPNVYGDWVDENTQAAPVPSAVPTNVYGNWQGYTPPPVATPYGGAALKHSIGESALARTLAGLGDIGKMLLGPDSESSAPSEQLVQQTTGLQQDTGNSAANIAAAGLSSAALSLSPGGELSLAPGFVSGAASEATKQAGGGPLAQTAAGLAAPWSAPVWRGLWQKLLQINPETAAANMAKIVAATGNPDATGTLGQIAGPETRAQSLETLVSRLPGAGVIRKTAQATNTQIGQNAMDIATNLGAFDTAETAGSTVQSDLEGYLASLRQKKDAAYAAVPKGTSADLSSTYAALDSEFAKPGNSDVVNYLKSDPSVQDLLRYRDTLQPGWTELPFQIGGKRTWIGPDNQLTHKFPGGDIENVPYDLANNARKNMGAQVDRSYNQGGQTTIQNGALAQVSNTLTGDVGTTLASIPGGKEALARAQAANQAYRTAADNVSSVVNADLPEKAYQAVFSGTDKGSTKLASVYAGLSPQKQQQLTGSLLERLGRPLPGSADAFGESWSANRFLTNWNKMSDTAKDIIQGSMPQNYRENMDAIASFANQLREGNQFYANPSGTAHTRTALEAILDAAHGLAGMGLGLVAGHGGGIAAGAGTLAGVAATYGVTVPLSARAFTNPTVVRWLAAGTRLPANYAPVVIQQLSKADPELARLLNSTGAQQQAQ